MPPVIAVLVAITLTEAVVIGVTVISAVAGYNQAKKTAAAIEDEMRRQEEAQALLDKQAETESAFAGGGGVGYEPPVREDSKLMLKSAKAPRNVVLGRDRVSGPMACFFSFEQDGVLFHRFAVVLAGHESDAIESVWFDEDQLTIDGEGAVTAPEKYTDAGRPLFRINNYLGGATQQASVMLMDGAVRAGNESAWNGSRLGRGVTYVAIQMEANYDALSGVGIPNVSAVVRGVKAFDPRNNTTAWTRNPALLARWWLVDSIYSPKTNPDEIDLTELVASANVCDEIINFSPTAVDYRYCSDGTLNTNANPLANLEKIVGSMDGDLIWIGGKWQIIAGYYKAPTLHIDESSLGPGAISISPYAPTTQLINAISGQCKGPSTKYQSQGYPMVTSAVYQAEDGGELYERKDDFDLVNYPIRCQMITWQRLARARQQLALMLDCNLKAYNTSPLQNVTVSLAEFGYTNKIFSVRRRQFSGSHIEYSLQETGPGVWAWNYNDVDAVVDIPNTNLPLSQVVPSVLNIIASSGKDSLLKNKDGTITSRIKLNWDLVNSPYVRDGGRLDFQYQRVVDSVADIWINAVPISGDQTSAYLDPVIDGAVYNIRARAVNQIGARGAWSAMLTHTVIGKTEPPADVQTLEIDGSLLSWSSVPDVDLAGYTLRFNYGGNMAWGTATPINTGVITQSPFDWPLRPAGQVTVLIKAIDTTGNESLQATPLFTNLGDRYIANVVEEFDFYPAFLGDLTGGVRTGGQLVANSSSAFYPSGNQPFYPSGALPFYPATVYEAMVYVTETFLVSSALSGSLLTLLLTYEGTGLQIEYRSSRPDPTFGGDELEPFYQLDAEPFYGEDADWQPWPGQITATSDIYQFRVTIGSGTVRPKVMTMKVIVDALDIEETINNLSLAVGGTVLPYTKPFTVIKSIQATLQSGLSGAVNIVTNKTNPAAPVATAVNSSLVAVAGASGDFTLKGY